MRIKTTFTHDSATHTGIQNNPQHTNLHKNQTQNMLQTE